MTSQLGWPASALSTTDDQGNQATTAMEVVDDTLVQTAAFMPRTQLRFLISCWYTGMRDGKSTAAPVKGLSTRTAVVRLCSRMTRPSVKPMILWRRSSGRRTRRHLAV
uniref:Uncharacterized protein n=1 Tax=Triticum urartu TaxID=4572 RepID=A0A8R7URA3_TRIUA